MTADATERRIERFISLYGYMAFMKTTVLLEDKLYRKLMQEAMQKYGTAKNLSLMLNELLKAKFTPISGMFGKLERFSLEGLRDEHDRSD